MNESKSFWSTRKPNGKTGMQGKILAEALKPPVIKRIASDIAIHTDQPETDTTRSDVLKRTGHTQLSGGSGYQKLQGLIADGMIEPKPDESKQLLLTEEAARIIIVQYEHDIDEMQLVVNSLRRQYPHIP